MHKRLLCTILPSPHRPVPLSESEAHHALRVLRLRDGDTVEALDGNGAHASVTLRTRGGPARLEFTEPAKKEESSSLPITLEMAVLKGDAMEWIVEKAVELGVAHLKPVLTAHTVVQTKAKGPTFFQERWQKIADQALKQCGRLSRMIVHPPVSLEELLLESKSISSARLWCDEEKTKDRAFILDWLQGQNSLVISGISILVGPEGGWSSNERLYLHRESEQHLIHRISLGPLTLRAETAALFATSLASAHLLSQNAANKSEL